MKIIKIILLVLVALAGIAATIGFLSPAHVQVKRSATIKAPYEVIFSQVNSFKNWKNWSPWYKMDTAMHMEFNSIASGVGAGYKWSSQNPKVGSGDMTILASTRDSICTLINMEYGVSFGKFFFTKKDSADSSHSATQITWVMEKDMGMNPIGRIMGLYMDKMIGPDFEKGLSNLAKLAEAIPSGPKTYRGYQVMEEETPQKVYIIKKDSVHWDGIEAFSQAIEKAKLETTGAPSSLYFKWDSVSKMALMAVAVPVNADEKIKVKGYETLVIPASRNLHIVYKGSYRKIASAHYAMNEYIKEKNFLQENPVIEEYITGPDKETDSTRWVTNVYYRVK
jgi:effector-binding domain-containing protein